MASLWQANNTNVWALRRPRVLEASPPVQGDLAFILTVSKQDTAFWRCLGNWKSSTSAIAGAKLASGPLARVRLGEAWERGERKETEASPVTCQVPGRAFVQIYLILPNLPNFFLKQPSVFPPFSGEESEALRGRAAESVVKLLGPRHLTLSCPCFVLPGKEEWEKEDRGGGRGEREGLYGDSPVIAAVVSGGQANNVHFSFPQYIHPADAVKLGQAELVVIDEAAAIPLPLVKSLLGPYLVFMASTINGWAPGAGAVAHFTSCCQLGRI